MKISQTGLDLIKRFEGFSSKPYLCPAGKWTVGYGHTAGVTADHPHITSQEGETLLRDDVSAAERAIGKLIRVPLEQHQFDALVSLVYNCGPAPLGKTLGNALNAGRYDEVPAQFMRWCTAGGKVLAGLQARRKAEAAMFAGTA